MRFLTNEQSEAWIAGRGMALPERKPSQAFHRVQIDDWHSLALAQWIAEVLTRRDEVLLWVTEWKIWPSQENWHLYYALRQLAGDRGLLPEAPGHLFLAYEMEELKTILQVSLMNGWGGYFLAARGNITAFFSHDGFVDFFADTSEELSALRKRFAAS
jgi:hypothetical protein